MSKKWELEGGEEHDHSSCVLPLTNLSSVLLLTEKISERREVSMERYLLINH